MATPSDKNKNHINPSEVNQTTSDVLKNNQKNDEARDVAILNVLLKGVFGYSTKSTSLKQAETAVNTSFSKPNNIFSVVESIKKSIDEIKDYVVASGNDNSKNVPTKEVSQVHVIVDGFGNTRESGVLQANETMQHLKQAARNIVSLTSATLADNHINGKNGKKKNNAIDVNINNVKELRSLLEEIKNKKSETIVKSNAVDSLYSLIETVTKLNELSSKDIRRAARNLEVLNEELLGSFLESCKKIDDVAKNFSDNGGVNLGIIAGGIGEILKVVKSLTWFGFAAPLIMFGIVSLGKTFELLNKVVISKLPDKDLSKLNDTVASLNSFGKTVVLFAGTLLAGSLLIRLIRFKDFFKFTASLAIFVTALSGIFVLITRFVNEKDFAKSIEAFSHLVAIAAGVLMVGSLFMKIPGSFRYAMMFTATMTLFVLGLSVSFVLMNLITRSSGAGILAFATLVAVSAGVLMIGSLFMLIPNVGARAIGFGLLLAMFITIIGGAYRLTTLFAFDAYKDAKSLAILIGVSATILMVGGIFMTHRDWVVGSIAFAILLGLFLTFISKALAPLMGSATIGKAGLKMTHSQAIGLAVLIGLTGGMLLTAGYLIAKNPKIGLYSFIFAAITGAFIWGMTAIIKSLGSSELSGKSLAKGELALLGMLGIIELTGYVLGDITRIANTYGRTNILKTLGVVALTFIGAGVIISAVIGSAMIIGSIASGGLSLKSLFSKAGLSSILNGSSAGTIDAGLIAMAKAELVLAGIDVVIWGAAKAIEAVAKLGKYDYNRIKDMLVIIAETFICVGALIDIIAMIGNRLPGGMEAIGLAELVLAGIDVIIWGAAKAVEEIAIASIKATEASKKSDVTSIVTLIGGFLSSWFSLATESLGFTILIAPFTLMLFSIAGALSMMAVALKQWVDLKIPIYEGTKIVGYTTLTDSDFATAADNIKRVITALACGLVDGIKERPDLFNDNLFTDSPALNAAKTVGILGNALMPIAEGIKDMGELKFPIYEGTKIVGYTTLQSGSIKIATDNIKLIITALAKGLVDGINDNNDLFGEGWFGITESPAMNAAKTVSVLSNAIVPLVKGLDAMSNLKFPIYEGTTISGYTTITRDGIGQAASSIESIVTAAAQGLVNGVKNHPYLFGEGLFTDSPAMNAAKAVTQVSQGINILARIVGMYARGVFPIAYTDENGHLVIDKNSLTPVSPEEKQNAKIAITGIIDTVLQAIVAANNKAQGMFDSGFFGGESSGNNAANAVLQLANGLSAIVKVIGQITKLNVNEIKNNLKSFKIRLTDILGGVVEILQLLISPGASFLNGAGKGERGVIAIAWNKLTGGNSSDDLSFAELLNSKQKDLKELQSSLTAVSDVFSPLLSIINSWGGDEFNKSWKSFGGKGNSLASKIKATLSNILESLQYLSDENRLKQLSSFNDNYDVISSSLSNYESVTSTLKNILKNVSDASTNSKNNSVKTIIGAINQIHQAVSKIQAKQIEGFATETNNLDKFVKSVNSIDVNNVSEFTGLVAQLNRLGANMKGLDRFTDVLAKRLASELAELTRQLHHAELTIKNADVLQKRRHKLIADSVKNVKKIMEQKINVEITQVQPELNSTGDSSLDTSDSSNSSGTSTSTTSETPSEDSKQHTSRVKQARSFGGGGMPDLPISGGALRVYVVNNPSKNR